MNTAPSLPPCPTTQTPHASIVLIYDSFETAVRGKAFCDKLAAKLEIQTDLGEALWRTELLAIPEIRQEAARAALAADYVVLALHGDEALSTGLDHWLAAWMPRARDREISLVVLFDPARARREPTSHILSFLRIAAFASGVHFFAHTTLLGGETGGVGTAVAGTAGHGRGNGGRCEAETAAGPVTPAPAAVPLQPSPARTGKRRSKARSDGLTHVSDSECDTIKFDAW